jgi:type II secretory pathway predicted ATPase ExeA
MPPTAPTSAGRGPEPTDLEGLAGQKLGNYRLEQLVGRGRMGVVYRATDEALLRPTAVKVLSWAVAEAAGQDPVAWFLSEARLVARINHPRVVQIYGVARHGAFCYIAMEYVAGESADALVARAGPMAPEAATEVLLQAAAALQAAHASGVVHRDVKPGNLLVGPGRVTKLGDFGMALGPPDIRIGNARLRVGTPWYTAPEVWRGEPAGPGADIYSLGATYFHLLTGRPPYPGPDVPSVEQGHLRGPVPDPRTLRPNLPAGCASLVMRALAKATGQRHASAQELLWEGRRILQELQLAAAGGPEAAAPGPERRPERPPPLPRQASTAPAPAPSELLAAAFGFVRRPFAEPDPADPPYRGEPFASARLALLGLLDDRAEPALAVTGPEGSGRSVLCRGLAAELGGTRMALVLDLARDTGGRSAISRLCRAAGALEASATASLEALVERLGEEHRLRGCRPLLVLDGASAAAAAPDLPALVAAARGTGAFQVLLVGAPGLGQAFGRREAERLPEVPLAPLDRAQQAGYLAAWLRAARPAAAPPIVVSADALLLAALRTQGLPARLDCLAENMLLLAAAARGHALTSWHAWAASDQERWAGRPAAALPRRPEAWPPPEVVAVIDACRRGAGLPPWPRGSA